MNTFQEINNLRKKGQLDEAYALAQSALAQVPGDAWLLRAKAWVLYEYLDRFASFQTLDAYKKWLSEFVQLPREEKGTILYSSVAWSLRKLLADMASKDFSSSVMDELFQLFKSIPFPPSEDSYSALLSAALKLERKWDNLYLFIEWWNLDNLTADDYQEVKLKNGRSLLSPAERVFIVYSKWLLDNDDAQRLQSFLPRLQSVVETQPQLVYPPYYLAKLFINQRRLEEANGLLKKFAKSKAKDFWVWQLLAEAQTDKSLVLSFYCKALACGGKEEMLVSLREHAAVYMVENGFCPEAKLEEDKALATRKGKGWHIPAGLSSLQHADWYAATEPSKDNRKFYQSHSQAAEEFVFGAVAKLTCLVIYVNKEKRMVSFVTEEREQGFFKCPANCSLPMVNRLVDIETAEVLEDKPTVVRSVTCVEGTDNERFYKPFAEKLRLFQGFGMVGKVFVEGGLLAGLEDKKCVTGLSILSYDRKKKKWGWRALSIALTEK